MTTHYGNAAWSTLTNNAPNFEDLNDGEQYKFNHMDCPSGVDTRERLSVLKVDGAYLWHCYNCGDSGYYRPRETIRSIREETKVALELRGKKTTYEDLTKEENYDKFRIEGQLWLGQYEFGSELCLKYKIVETKEGVVLPIYVNHEIVGFQIRRYDKKPKYHTYSNNGYSFLANETLLSDDVPLIVVEDLLSSYKLHYCGYATLCLLGTKLAAGAVEILQHYRNKKVLIWLDDDVAGHQAACKLVKELSVMLPLTQSMFNKQPKEFPLEELMNMEF